MSKRRDKRDADDRKAPAGGEDRESVPVPPGLIAVFVVPLVLLVVWAMLQ